MAAFGPVGSGVVGVGLIGVGNISDTYLENLTSFPDVQVLIVGDLLQDRARSQAEKHGIPASGSTADVLAHPGVEIVVNLTIPAVHVEVSSAAVAAGKHVWSEKPIATDRESARLLLNQADAAGLRVGVAPDTVLGPGIQSAKRAIERGDIGVPLFAQTGMQYQGPEVFHPNPGFLFAHGAGPLFDMGPYYFTTLVSILGPVAAVAALGLKRSRGAHDPGRSRRRHRVPGGGALDDQRAGHLERGAQSQSLLSFDSPLRRHGVVEISGTEGTIVLPDPNMFTGRTAITRRFGRPDRQQTGWSRGPEAKGRRRRTRASACSTWRAPSAPVPRTARRANSASTCSTP